MGSIRLGDSNPVRVIGTINLTRNSFYNGSVRTGLDEIVEEARRMEELEADIIDLGARSTAPYRKYDIPEKTETRLLSAAIRAVSAKINVPISADTSRFEPAKAALNVGATILNDVHCLTQRDGKRVAHLVASKDCALLLTAHETRTGKSADPMKRVLDSLRWGVDFAVSNGVERKYITVDPGIGFFSDTRVTNVDWNVEVLTRLEEMRALRRPICVGLSRKRFIGKLVGDKPPEGRLHGSLSATAMAVYEGAHMIRTHDVLETVDAVKVARAFREKRLIRDAD
jgi:dihydropteroate synthase